MLPLLICLMAAGFNDPLRTTEFFAFGFSSVDSILESMRNGRCVAMWTPPMERPRPRPMVFGRQRIERNSKEAILRIIS